MGLLKLAAMKLVIAWWAWGMVRVWRLGVEARRREKGGKMVAGETRVRVTTT